MTLDALQLDVPEALQTDSINLTELGECLRAARHEQPETGLQTALDLLARVNRSAMTLLERQRALQNFSDEYRHYSTPSGNPAATNQIRNWTKN